MSFVLRAIAGELAGSCFPITGELVVGRAEGCEVRIADPKLSRRHARILLERDKLVLEDLDSQHGSFVNGVRTVRSEVLGGDLVALGGSRFRVETVLAEDATPVQLIAEQSLRARLVKQFHPAETPNLGARNFALLYEISQAIQSERDAGRVLAAVLDRLLVAVNGDRAYVALRAPSGLIPKAVRYRDPKHVPAGKSRVAMSKTVAEQVLGERCAMISQETAADDRFATTDTVLLSDIRSLMAAPLVVGDRVLGLVEVEVFDRATTLTEGDLDLLSVIASTLAVALDNLELARLREETIEKLRAAQAELLATQDRLVYSEQMAVIGRFASGIAHEVKNHLGPFMLAEMIATKYPGDAEIAEVSEMMLEAQRHIFGLVDEIRVFAKGAQSDYEMQPHDLGHVVEGVTRFLRCDAKLKRASLELIVESSPLVIMDASRIRQVLINLVRNAADATEGRPDAQIRVRLREKDEAALIDVMDNGPGIPDEVKARIFEPFFSTKGDKGLGLGLDISRKIVEAHGGKLSFHSAPGKGTTFRIKLPLEPAGA